MFQQPLYLFLQKRREKETRPCCSRNTSRPSAPISLSSCFPSCCSSRCFLSVTSSLSSWCRWWCGVWGGGLRWPTLHFGSSQLQFDSSGRTTRKMKKEEVKKQTGSPGRERWRPSAEHQSHWFLFPHLPSDVSLALCSAPLPSWSCHFLSEARLSILAATAEEAEEERKWEEGP